MFCYLLQDFNSFISHLHRLSCMLQEATIRFNDSQPLLEQTYFSDEPKDQEDTISPPQNPTTVPPLFGLHKYPHFLSHHLHKPISHSSEISSPQVSQDLLSFFIVFSLLLHHPLILQSLHLYSHLLLLYPRNHSHCIVCGHSCSTPFFIQLIVDRH